MHKSHPPAYREDYDYDCEGAVVQWLVRQTSVRSGGRWFEPGLCHRVDSLGKKLYFTLSLFTQVYKWVPAIIMLGVTLR